MENKFKELKEMINYPEGGIVSKVIEKDDVGNVTLFCMGKGTDISTHTSTKPGYVYVIEGEGTFKLEGEDIPMKEGTLIFMDANAKHSLNATENTAFVLILISK